MVRPSFRHVAAICLALTCAFVPIVHGQTAQWTTIPVTSVRSTGSERPTVVEGVVRADRGSDKRPTWTVTATLPAGHTVTGLRLEALADPALPKKGPGTNGNGNFVLSEVDATLLVGDRERPLRFLRASATYGSGQAKAYRAIDRHPRTGWHVHGRIGKSHALWVRLVKPATVPKTGGRLRLRLHFNSKAQIIGRLRLAITDDERPLRGTADPLGERWLKTQTRINTAIDRGVHALLTQQELDGSWREHQGTYPSGMTALAIYTLVKCGVAPDASAVRRGVDFLLANEPRRTYATATQILAFVAIKDARHKRHVQKLVDRLAGWQDEGGFAYPAGTQDLSNTQYAALALRAASLAGYRVSRRVWVRLARFVVRHQVGEAARYDAGFRYRRGKEPTGSMTAAGVGILAMAKEMGGVKDQSTITGTKRGIAWLAKHFAVTNNPHPGFKREDKADPSDGNTLYYLYGLERLGAVLAIDRIGPFDWYRQGAFHLITMQSTNGLWENSQSKTSFALLFLSKATRSLSGRSITKRYGTIDPAEPISLRGLGDSPITLWVASFGNRVNRRHAWPGEATPRVLRVEYFAKRIGTDAAAVKIATVDGSSANAAGESRFQVQHHFTEADAYDVHVVATIAPPAKKGAPRAEPIEIRSKPMRVDISQPWHPELERYASDRKRNLLAGKKLEATASSALSGSYVATYATDGRLGRVWMSKDDDPKPSLTLRLRRPIRANTLVLSHAIDRRAPKSDRKARIRTVTVKLNGKPPIEAEMRPGEHEKTVIRFKTRSIRSIELTVTDVKRTLSKKKSVGFAEVELQMRRKSKS